MSKAEILEIGTKLHKIKCFDNGGVTFDRYTVVYKSEKFRESRGSSRTYYPYIGMSEDPFHPQGFGQHGELRTIPREGTSLGKRIEFKDLPEPCRRAVIQDLS